MSHLTAVSRRPWRAVLSAGAVAAALVVAGPTDAGHAASAPAGGPCSYGDYDGDASISFDGEAAVGSPFTATVVAGGGGTPDVGTGGIDFTWSGVGFGDPVRGHTFTARYDLVGAPVHLSVRARNGGSTRFAAECDFEHVDWGRIERPAAPQVTGRPVLGGTLHAHSGAGDSLPPRASYHYEWFAGDSTSAFATGEDVELGAAEVGETIVVKTMVTANGYRDSVWSARTETAEVVEGTLARPGAPAITGNPVMGGTLSASPDASDHYPAGATYDYEWFAGGDRFATGSQVTLGAGQVGRAITVRTRADATGYAASDWSVASAPTAAVAVGDLATPSSIAVTGTPKVGESLTAVVTGAWTPGASVVFAWKADGVTFSTDPGTVRLTTAEVGKTITVQVTGSLDGYATESIESAGLGPVVGGLLMAAPGTPTITGAPRVGQVLTAAPAPGDPEWPAGATYHYEWLADGQPFAIGDRVTLAAGQIGRTISVRTQVTAPGYVDSEWSAASAPTAAVTGSDLATPDSVRITGRARVGESLRAVVAGSWTPGTAVSSTWRANGVTFGTGPRVVLTGSELGKRITVTLTGALDGYEPATVRSGRTAEVGAGVLTAPRPTISGRAELGRTLTAEPGRWTTGTRLSYHWYANGRPIRNATDIKLELTRTLRHQHISVKVTGRLAGYTTETRSSRPTGKVR